MGPEHRRTGRMVTARRDEMPSVKALPKTGPRPRFIRVVDVGIVALIALIGPMRWPEGSPAQASAPAPSSAATPGAWVIINGRGFGHGVGMAQDGAYWMGRQGRSAAEILRLFFPGTSLGKRSGDVRVPLAGGGSVRLDLPQGGTVGERPVPVGTTIIIRTDGGALVATYASNLKSTAGTDEESVPKSPKVSEAPIASAAPAAPAAVAMAMERISARFQAPSEPGGSASVGTGASSGVPTLPGAATASGAIAVPALESPTTLIPAVPAAPPGPDGAAPAPPVEGSATPTPPSTGAPVNPSPEPTGATDTTNVTATDATTDEKAPQNTVRGTTIIVEPTDGTTLTYGGKPYRGRFELTARGGVRVVNELDVEQYLRGMGEITDSRWPAAALEAQAIAARTYAFRTMASAGEVCPTQRCQVYFGARAEYAAMDKAVAATRGKVVTYDKGKLAITFYSASGGGTIASPEEAFGGKSDISYLQPGVYPTGDLKAWVVTLTITEVGRRLGYRGTASAIAVTKVGPSGRAVEVTVTGSGAPMTIAGPRFDAVLGLRSTMFTIAQSSSPTIDVGDDVEVLLLGRSGASGEADTNSTPLEFSQTGLTVDDTTVITSDGTDVGTDVGTEDGTDEGNGTAAGTAMLGTGPVDTVRPSSKQLRASKGRPASALEPARRAEGSAPAPGQGSGRLAELTFVGVLIIPFVAVGAIVRRRRHRRRPLNS